MKYLIFGLMFGIAGCATTGGYEKVLQTWVSKSETDLVRAWGPPANSFKTQSGDLIYTYVTSGGTTSQIHAATMFMPATVESTQNFCKTDFTLNNGVVTSWRWQGNMCRSRAPASN